MAHSCWRVFLCECVLNAKIAQNTTKIIGNSIKEMAALAKSQSLRFYKSIANNRFFVCIHFFSWKPIAIGIDHLV